MVLKLKSSHILNMLMILIIQENGKFNLKKGMEEAFNYGKINQSIVDNGKMISQMDLGNLKLQMEIIIQVIGLMVKQMGKEHL